MATQPSTENLRKHKVRYQLDYAHVVEVGIKAIDCEDAINRAQQLFDDGTIWDNTPEVPLLSDDYEEINGQSLQFSVEEIPEGEPFPAPDDSVIEETKRQAAFNAARLLVEAYNRAGEGGSVDWSDVDLAYVEALKCFGNDLVKNLKTA